MSHYNSALAVEDKEEIIESEFDLCLHAKHLSISDVSTEIKPNFKVIKVSGSITVSF